MPVPIVAVTGTKGKTTAVSVVADILLALGKNTLKVDTTGHFVNGERRSTLEDSKNTWQLVPTVAPGRYLWEFLAHPELQTNGYAVLEAALGSSSLKGMGYSRHKVGVFLNVYEDHLGSSDRLKDKNDIAEAKSFVFSRLQYNNSYAVFNADDELVVKMLYHLPSKAPGITKLPFGLTFEHFPIKQHLADGGKAITYQDGKIVLLEGNDKTVLFDLGSIPWTFEGRYSPSVWNLMAAAASVFGLLDGEWSPEITAAFESVRLDPTAGRLVVFKNTDDVTIIADYAHEKVSLELMGRLAATQVKEGSKTIGIVRLAYDRTDELLVETAEIIGRSYDEVVIYDKIDGYWRQPKQTVHFPQEVGRISQVMYDAMIKVNPNVTRIIREDEAVAYAATIAKPGDVVVSIVNDNIERSLGFIKESFHAELA
jgi:cyanophycin synthetase